MSESTRETRCGFVAVLGAPNVGKSTLVNAMVGGKVSIVTPKVQTTRTRVRGIAIAGEAQVVFVDTPGIFAPRRRLDRAMVAAAWTEAGDADAVLLLVDAARGLSGETEAILNRLAESRPARPMLAINKIDLVPRETLLALAAEANARLPFERTFMISAARGDGVPAILETVAAMMPAGPWLFPEDQLSDMPDRLLAAEITREQVMLQLQQELPYAMTVETDSWEERPDGSVKIHQTLYVRKAGQKSIVLGHGGTRIKAIGEAARRELERLLGVRVHLFLFVKVRENWADDPERYRDLGLDFNA